VACRFIFQCLLALAFGLSYTRKDINQEKQMNHKTLRRKCKRASKRSSRICLDQALLSRKEVLTPAEKERLAFTNKVAHRAIQVTGRLQRRVAKVTGANYIPPLMRSAFKRACTFKRIMKAQGAEAAVDYLLGTCPA
jgi:hypothetical protein